MLNILTLKKHQVKKILDSMFIVGYQHSINNLLQMFLKIQKKELLKQPSNTIKCGCKLLYLQVIIKLLSVYQYK